jgi:DNA-binding FrmR family transcriptional regulator
MGVPQTSSLPHDSKAAILARLKTAHGHLDGIIRLVIRDTYCVGWSSRRTGAIRGTLDRVGRIEFENHLKHCPAEQI